MFGDFLSNDKKESIVELHYPNIAFPKNLTFRTQSF